MNSYKKRTQNKSHLLYCLLTLLLVCACTDVPEHCSDHNPLDPFRQFCYAGKAVDKCNGSEYNPSAQFCYQSKTLINKCGGAEYDPATQGCYSGVVRSDANVLTVNIEPTGGGSVSRYPNQTNYKWETTVTVTATAASGYKFTGWSGASTDTSNSVTIIMTGNLTLTANFQKPTVTPPIDTAKYAVVVSSAGTGAIGGGDYAAGAIVTINAGAAPAGQVFKNWTTGSAGVTFANANNSSTSFTMPANAVTVIANFETSVVEPAKYTVTVTSAGTNATGNGSYTADATVNISAGTAPAGQAFDKWTTSSGGVSFANANSAATTFTMPSNAVTVTANWKQAFTDGRDNKTYKKVVIGGKTWMAENLNYATSSGSWCYNNSTDSCAKYGRLYDWATAMDISTTYNSAQWNGSDVKHQGVCPAGWHLPSYQEWDALVTAAGGSSVAGKALKSKTGWISYSDITNEDTYGFSALPGGYYYGSSFDLVGYNGFWWTATEYYGELAFGRNMGYTYDGVGGINDNKSVGFAVRCVEGAASLYAVTVTNGTGSGSYAAGATVSISAGTPPTGQVFKNWTVTSGGVTLANANSAATSFTMPANAVTVTATWKQVYDYSLSCGNRACRTVEIGGKTWMAENLNIETENSWCCLNSSDSCAKYGRLYTWDAAQTACPSGWHLPSREEWGALAVAAGGTGTYGTGGTAGKALKSTSGWYNNGGGTDTLGFSALPGSYRNSDGTFVNVGGHSGDWWTATEGSSEGAYGRSIFSNTNYVYENHYHKSYGFAVRCLAD